MRLASLCAALCWLGCATDPAPRETISAEEAFGTPRVEPLTPNRAPGRKPLGQVNVEPPKSLPAWAKKFRRPVDCAEGARDMEKTWGHDTGWEALKACVARGDFSLLAELLTWADDLRTQPEGPELIARVEGQRGGYLVEDLKRLAAKNLPVIGLDLATLPTAKGKYVLVVARANELTGPRSKQEAVLHELALVARPTGDLHATHSDVMSPPETSPSPTPTYSPHTSGALPHASTRSPMPQPSGTVSVSGSPQGAVNELTETGRELRVRLTRHEDLPLDTDFIFLLRVETVVTERHEELADPVRAPVTSLVGWYSVHPEKF